MTNQLISAQNSILEMQGKQLELLAEIQSLKEENKTLKEAPDLRKKLIFMDKAYQLNESGAADGTYCQVCFDSQGKLCRLSLIENGGWWCGVCKTQFGGR